MNQRKMRWRSGLASTAREKPRTGSLERKYWNFQVAASGPASSPSTPPGWSKNSDRQNQFIVGLRTVQSTGHVSRMSQYHKKCTFCLSVVILNKRRHNPPSLHQRVCAGGPNLGAPFGETVQLHSALFVCSMFYNVPHSFSTMCSNQTAYSTLT